MNNQLKFEEVLPNTYKGDLIDFTVGNKWTPCGFFALYGRFAHVNGVLCQVFESGGYSPVHYEGENIFNCACCGHFILNHYTVKNQEGRKVNVGSECIKNIINPKLADLIVGYVEGIERKAKSENRRKPKNEQLQKWVQEHLEELNDYRNKRIDKELQANPEKYWLAKYHIDTDKHKPEKCWYEVKLANGKKVKVFDNSKTVYSTILVDYSYDIEKWKNFNAPNYRRGTFPQDSEIVDIIRSKNAKAEEMRDRNQYKYLACNLVTKNWNPDTMKKVIEQNCAIDEYTQCNFKWEKFSEEFLIAEKQFITDSVNEYLDRIQAKLS